MKGQTNRMNDLLGNFISNVSIYLKTKGKLFLLAWLYLCIAFYSIGVKGWLWLGLLIAFLDLLPMIGSGIVFIPWSIVYFFNRDFKMGLLVMGIYLLLILIEQLGENFWLGRHLEMPFWIPFITTILCSVFFGPLGILLTAIMIPLLATLYHYYQKQ